MEQNNTPQMPLLGDRFPSLSVTTTHGPMNIPEDLEGSWFVLFSHPADFTPVCTTEFVSFQERKPQFDELNTRLIGLSVDDVFLHNKWVQWIKENLNVQIEFPIVAANDSVAAAIGLLHPGKGTNTVRAVFIVDPTGAIRTILYYPQEIGRNMDEVVRAVKALQVSDAQGAVPADWPKNSLIGDRIIVPPATDVTTADRRLSEYQGYDWWFVHKEYKK